MKKLWPLWLAIAVLIFFYLWERTPRAKSYNQQQCAVYGMQADCKTPLAPTVTPTVAPTIAPPLLSAQLEKLVNDYRISENKAPFKHDARLCDFAKTRAVETGEDWSHDKFYPKTQALMIRFKFTKIGENLGKEFSTAQGMVNGWIKSPTHKANLDYDYQFTCIQCLGDRCAQILAI